MPNCSNESVDISYVFSKFWQGGPYEKLYENLCRLYKILRIISSVIANGVEECRFGFLSGAILFVYEYKTQTLHIHAAG